MEDNNKSLITINSSLAKIEKQIAIGEKLLGLNFSTSEREKVKKFLVTNPDFTCFLLGHCYDLKFYQLEKYLEQWNWDYIVYNNKNIELSVDFIEKFGSKLDWGWDGFVQNPNIIWTDEIIDTVMKKYNHNFKTGGLLHAKRGGKLTSYDVLKKYKNKITLDEITTFGNLPPVTEEIIDLYINEWDCKKLLKATIIDFNEKIFEKIY